MFKFLEICFQIMFLWRDLFKFQEYSICQNENFKPNSLFSKLVSKLPMYFGTSVNAGSPWLLFFSFSPPQNKHASFNTHKLQIFTNINEVIPNTWEAYKQEKAYIYPNLYPLVYLVLSSQRNSWKMLNWPKNLNAASTKVTLQCFPPVCPLPHSNFLKQIGWYLGIFWTHNLSCYECSKGYITCPVTCYIPLIPITFSRHA